MKTGTRSASTKKSGDTPRDEARQATILAFAARFPGMPVIPNKYQGDFPYLEVAEGIAVPDSPRLRDHQYAWSKLYEGFDAVWRHLHG